ncbi:hypothetical protein BDW02DRAFT_597127 [Decorospora gaudefroyi]|uniref:F-box domain-containing protein n=1 Tax=Decorospora gaudefroyi TaxID=184978 RepID=A0A6A5KIH4_9PLEO|nr:hypothetical protein BDW02DRAFT_597127 [Decorospora gaudefroyi]
MSLLQLPSETLIQIFDYVGSSYFRSDLSRLAVCKQWSKFAHTACFRDFYVTQKTVRRLLSSPYVESSLPLVKDSVETLDLALKGFEDWDSILLSRHESRTSQEHGEGFHVCTSIAALLTTLRRLRLRIRSICADVLKPRQQNTNLRLNEVLINLSLSDESPLATSAAHATCCASSAGGFLQLKADMEKKAQDLVAQMAAPRIVRIVTHALPSIEMRAFDVLTGRHVRLSGGAEWDDDGEAIEDEAEEEESEISDLSSSSDDG